MIPKTVVCLPTYNEAGNISQAVNKILSVLPHSHILVIDDNSPDGTGNLADRLAGEDSRIHVLHRLHKEGLGKAYCYGFRFALEQLNAELIVQMDADLSHPPEKLPCMIVSAREADLVIGSRYVSGGCTKNWNKFRLLVSRFGAVYARNVLNLTVYDPTAGFKVWHRDLLKRVLHRPISAGGYVFQVETIFYAFTMGAKIKEVPICFAERGQGKSKMTLSIAFEAFWRIPLIWLRNYKLSPFIEKERMSIG